MVFLSKLTWSNNEEKYKSTCSALGKITFPKIISFKMYISNMHIANKLSIIYRLVFYATFIVDWHKVFRSLKEIFILHCINEMECLASVVVAYPPPLAHSHPPSLTTSHFLHYTMDIV